MTTMPLDTERLRILSELYAHTCDRLQSHLKRRDRLLASVLLLIVIMLFYIYTPAEAAGVLSQFVSAKLGLETPVDLLFIQSTIWFALLAMVIKYFQSVVFIEREYGYIHALEGVLSRYYSDRAFTREGASYLDNYPMFLNWASFLYTMLIPAILLVVVVSKIAAEINQYGCAEPLVWFNTLIYVCLCSSVVLYLYAIHSRSKSDELQEPESLQNVEDVTK